MGQVTALQLSCITLCGISFVKHKILSQLCLVCSRSLQEDTGLTPFGWCKIKTAQKKERLVKIVVKNTGQNK